MYLFGCLLGVGRKMKKLSVIIVSYNNETLLKKCLDSLYSFNDLDDCLEIIVSDNSPNMSAYEFVKKNYKSVQIIHNSKNGGFGYGNNRGYDISTGEYLLFLNPDTYLIEPIFSYAVSKFENDNNLAAFGLSLVKPNMERNYSYGLIDGAGIIDWIKCLIYWRRGVFKEGEMFTSGADLFIRREIFEKIGYFDDNIFMYYEESDVCRRIKKLNNNYKIEYFSEKKVVHLEGATQIKDHRTVVNNYKRQLEAYKYYCEKYKLPFEKYLRRDIKLFKIRLLKYLVMKEKTKIDVEKEIISISKAELNRG